MGRIADFLGTPTPVQPPAQPRLNHQAPQLIMPAMSATPQNQGQPFVAHEQTFNQGQPHVVHEEPQYQNEVTQAPQVVLVNRNQDVDEAKFCLCIVWVCVTN
ncbi:hypothetical protein A2U01_0053283 [Trifolium medium]|uniref:Uncharacterized protein n=1 Tax=Trifolium medium TaxID=97028 RepID=A0A392R646_9FABA|nr:hypothetical protein [Trifolium medium]